MNNIAKTGVVTSQPDKLTEAGPYIIFTVLSRKRDIPSVNTILSKSLVGS